MRSLVFLIALFAVAAADQRHHRWGPHHSEAEMNIPQLALKLGATELVKLVQAAGLADALSGPGPFTVFAPTNAAIDYFAHLNPDLAANLTTVKTILEYHVISGRVYSSQLANDLLAPSLYPGLSIRINIYTHDGTTIATAEGSQVTLPDQNATNGVIHVIDRVMLPPLGDLVTSFDTVYLKEFTILFSLVKAAGLAETLSEKGPFTLFAPDDNAFKKLPESTLDMLKKDPAKLRKVLLYHVVAGAQWSAGFYANEPVTTVEGSKVTVLVDNIPDPLKKFSVHFGDSGMSHVTYPDFAATNGVIHTIDTVLVPSDL